MAMMKNTTPNAQLSFETQAVHGGRDDFRSLGVHAPPLDFSTTNPVTGIGSATASLDAMAAGGTPVDGQAIYARLFNPTVDRFEQALAGLENADAAVAFSSGMAALTACLMAARQVKPSAARPHVVAVRPIYGGSDHLLDGDLLGIDTTWARADEVAQAMRPETALVIIETPANPTLTLVDIEAVVEQAGDAAVLVDSTFATPVLQKPLNHGATLVLHSATKFLGGHGDVMAGVVATSNADWLAALRQVRVLTGAVLHPLAGYLLHRGLATLPVRVKTAQEGATVLAGRLAEHPAVERVCFPGQAADDPTGLVGRQMSGPGTMVTFELRGGYDAAAKTVEHLRLITPRGELRVDGQPHPASRCDDPSDRFRAGTTGRWHLSEHAPAVGRGLEDADDLWQDLDQALTRALEAPALDGQAFDGQASPETAPSPAQDPATQDLAAKDQVLAFASGG